MGSTPNSADVQVEPITDAKDLSQAFYVSSEAFGRQINDAIWVSLNPDWKTPKGQEYGTSRLVRAWNKINKDREGNPNTVYLKATLPVTSEDGQTERRIVGFAIWNQLSVVPGYGEVPSPELGDAVDILDPTEARFASQMFRSLWKRRIEYVNEKATSDPPAIFTLGLCTVDPAFQKRGIASKLVQWGLDEAKRRHGGLECTTEASRMGRSVYQRLGFKAEGDEDIVFEVDEEFKSRDKPPNLFLRTGIA
ncbi:hypothetical protein BU24DRAFT_423463 [Aaosphaeria arxii CBS 175.79]|uniref:N-acetyltransferase domain-containing protein n=1 Tax=Aaosphaeria arxii CBS 175.79 TaxID=1450172 RepID=A0A6A5XP89_9PLEO|nr:uncharacterized protein BU24DRAFT_423463 [Aaosphaeria arxii CBS 175.79]KAF2014540.1 hypothetical protein BU24DRAFT_423463 [Aaosphaeria arxii CBS 175.79]